VDELGDDAVEQDETGGVLLLHDEVAEGGRDGGRVVEFRLVFGLVVHRLRSVEQDVRAEVRLLLVLLDVEAVGAAVDLPVEEPEVVARRVLAVLGEFDGEPVVRALVESAHESFHDRPRAHIEACDLVQDSRVEIFALFGHGPLGGLRSVWCGGC